VLQWLYGGCLFFQGIQAMGMICRELARELKSDVLPNLQAKGIKSFLVRPHYYLQVMLNLTFLSWLVHKCLHVLAAGLHGEITVGFPRAHKMCWRRFYCMATAEHAHG